MSTTLDCSTVAAPSEFAGLGVSWIASIDLHGDGAPIGSAGIVSNGDTVYASTTSIYLATVSWDWYQPQVDARPVINPTPPPTLIHKFSLGEGGTASYIASGEVPGQLLNQFSMSEYEGDLRVATTTNDWNGSASLDVGRASAAARRQRAGADRRRRRPRHERADLRRSLPRHAGVRRDVPPDRSAVRDRPQRSRLRRC